MDDISEKMAARKRKKAESNKRAYARKKEAEAAKKKLQAAMDEHKPAPTTLKDMHEMYKAAKTDPNEPLKSSKPTGRPYNLAVERVPMEALKEEFPAFFKTTKPDYATLLKTEKDIPSSSNPSQQVLVDGSVFSRPLSQYLTALIILCFLLANAYFICSEQADFYQLTGYSRPYSVFIALLTESATVLLSYFTVSRQKPLLLLVLVPTVLVTFAIIYMGLQRKESAEIRNKHVGQLMQQEVETLEGKIINLKGEGKSAAIAERNLASKQKALAEWLKLPADIGEFETYAHAALRLLSVLWNVIFPGILAALWISPKRLFPD